jgi:hypothetical protein
MQQWHDDSIIDKWLKRGVSTVVILGAIIPFTLWASSMIVTDAEAQAMVKQAIDQHIEQQNAIPYAKKSDINMLVNMMVSEKIRDAKNEIQEIDDMIIDNTATPADLKKRSRLIKDIEDYENEKVPE